MTAVLCRRTKGHEGHNTKDADDEGKNNPITGLIPGCWSSHISGPSAHEGGKFVSPTHRPLYPQEIFLVLISVWCWDDPRVIVWPEGVSMKESNDTTENRTCDLPVCSAVPQPTAPPCAPWWRGYWHKVRCSTFVCHYCTRALRSGVRTNRITPYRYTKPVFWNTLYRFGCLDGPIQVSSRKRRPEHCTGGLQEVPFAYPYAFFNTCGAYKRGLGGRRGPKDVKEGTKTLKINKNVYDYATHKIITV